VEYLQPKPRVKIIGEFFSHIQEGNPSYHLPEWLLAEGAEPILEPVTTWVDYLIWSQQKHTRMRAFRSPWKAPRLLFLLSMLKWIIHAHYLFYRLLLGGKPRRLLSQPRLVRMAEPYYHTELSGGEGHMEVGKHIHSVKHREAHLVISIKPFGCMPSTQSDGVQMKVMEDLRSSFLSIDTSGDAEVNVKSRVAMKLQIVLQRVEQDYRALLEKLDINQKKIKKAGERKPKLRQACARLPHRFPSTAENALLLLAGNRKTGRATRFGA
jgi:predicted nucleotide-binding protein (sugar kinase/HSP70/actin superfamily)